MLHASDGGYGHGRIKTMGVNKFGIRRLMPEMNNITHYTDSSVGPRKLEQAQGPAPVSQEAPTTTLGIFNGAPGEDQNNIEALKFTHKMRLKLGQEDIVARGIGGYPPDLTNRGNLSNLLLKSGASHELSMSLPNLTAALDTELMNGVNERHVRSSLSNIFDNKSEATQKSLTELSKCIKTLSSENVSAMCEGADVARLTHNMDQIGQPSPTGVNSDDIKIEMNGGNNRLSAVLENIPLLYIPHTKQLVSMASQGKEKHVNSNSSPVSPQHKSSKSQEPEESSIENSHGEPVVGRNHTENGHVSPSHEALSVSNSPIPLQNYQTLDTSLNDSHTNLLNCSEPDVTFALSQDSDASSTCRSEHTVIHQEDYNSQERKNSRSVDFEEDTFECMSKVSLDRDSPRNTLQRTNTMGSLSKADASSFSSISSISTATDFSASAASCSDDYLELRGCGDVDESGFMEVNLHSRNTFERSRNSSQDSGIDEKQCLGAKPKRRGLSSFFAR